MAPTRALRLLGCALLLPSLRGEPDGCAPGWVPTHGGCLGFFPWELSWSRAESFCRRLGPRTHLASARSAAELRDVAELLSASRGSDGSGEDEDGDGDGERDGDVWIGLLRPARGRAWRWSDGTATAFSFGRGVGSPRRGNCAAMRGGAASPTWFARRCADRKPFVCRAGR